MKTSANLQKRFFHVVDAIILLGTFCLKIFFLLLKSKNKVHL